MSELFRTFNTRAVEVLNTNNINSFGIQSHPENYQSAQFRNWLTLCRVNNSAQVNTDMINYLRSGESIKKIKDLGEEWSKAIPSFLAVGNEITKEKSYAIIKEAKLDTVFGKEKNKYAVKRMAVADTILCLAHLKNLSHPSNIDYLSVLKIMTFVERCFDYKMELPEFNIIKHFDKQVLLPSCFSKINPCDYTISSSPFPFLENTTELRTADKIIAGCKNDGKCNCRVNDECVEQNHCCAKPRIDLIDLMIVKDYTKCYQAGDLSFIKNVLEGEVLSTKHRRLERTEDLTETQEDLRTFEEKYLQTEDKASLQNETDNIIKNDNAFSAGVTANLSYGAELTGKFTGGVTSNFSNNQSKSQTNKEVRNSSKDILDRATKQVEEKVRKLVSQKRIFETEETNKHSFINTDGPNISGQYLYVDKISRAQVYNYGRKAVIDLILPEPAALYKRLFKNDYEGLMPIAPTPIVIDPKTITPENYKTLVTQYGLTDVSKPPDFEKSVITVVQGEYNDPKTSNSGDNYKDFPISIPSNYIGCQMKMTNNIQLDYNTNFHLLPSPHTTPAGVSLTVSYGGSNVYNSAAGTHNYTATINNTEGNGVLSVRAFDVTKYAWEITVKCALKDEFKTQWQDEVYAKITEVNAKALEEYNKALAEYQKAKEEFELNEAELKKERYNKNPFINRETEKEELKRMVISYISCQFYDQFDAMKNRVKPCGFPEMNIKEAEQEGKFIQFFEQAFSWNLITYLFYPYFWGKKCTWADKHKDESNDLIFEKFLAAGSCRVLVPIRDGYFDYVSYFLASGEIYGGSGTPPVPNDPHYVSLAQEIKEQKQNFNADREGTLDTTNGSTATLTNIITLNNSDHYWDYGSLAISATVGPPPTPTIPAVPAGPNTMNINADIDREIIIDCKVYRIISIQENTTITDHTSWNITLDRNYEDVRLPNVIWSTGAVFVGAPWEFVTPTTLTFLRDKSSCLPCYPLKECKEG
ncbi:MAG: hypothetical protein JWN78_1723 [Bacteroidota bacterium]|nr:hypothetical protein [Bacteroidota bacterium]